MLRRDRTHGPCSVLQSVGSGEPERQVAHRAFGLLLMISCLFLCACASISGGATASVRSTSTIPCSAPTTTDHTCTPTHGTIDSSKTAHVTATQAQQSAESNPNSPYLPANAVDTKDHTITVPVFVTAPNGQQIEYDLHAVDNNGIVINQLDFTLPAGSQVMLPLNGRFEIVGSYQGGRFVPALFREYVPITDPATGQTAQVAINFSLQGDSHAFSDGAITFSPEIMAVLNSGKQFTNSDPLEHFPVAQFTDQQVGTPLFTVNKASTMAINVPYDSDENGIPTYVPLSIKFLEQNGKVVELSNS